ncbi:MAG: hypothetical protein WDZ35_07990 [Crocinitomicaceae bacterium]
MIIRIAVVQLLLMSFYCSAQSNFRYQPGIVIGYDMLQPRSYKSEIEYFSSTYFAGSAPMIGMSNKLNYKKWFIQLEGVISLSIQKQEFVFSNPIDQIIDHTVTHQVPHWMVGFSVGRDFRLNDVDNMFHVELGISNTGHFGNNSNLDVTGTFTSTYTNEDDHWSGEMSTTEYEYAIGYTKNLVYLAPFLKSGLSVPLSKNRIEFGISAKLKRLVYENFIYISSDSYSAIANSRSRSSSIGIYLNYQFGKN